MNGGWIYHDRIAGDSAGSSLLDYYTGRYTHSSQEQWRQRIVSGQVQMDAEVVTDPDRVLAAGQILAYHRPPWRESDVPTDIGIVFEDAPLLVVDKPAGLPVLPGGNFLEHTLLWMLRARHSQTLAPLHRLGRGTSGLIAFGKSDAARSGLSADFARGHVEKTYRALVSGQVHADEFTVTNPIGRVDYPPLGSVFAVADASTGAGKDSRSEVRVLERAEDESLVEVRIPTGRPHQIRIHLAAAGHPLVGERLYAAGGLPRPLARSGPPPLPGDGGFHLHSTRLSLRHPADPAAVVSLWSLPPERLRTRAESDPEGRISRRHARALSS